MAVSLNIGTGAVQGADDLVSFVVRTGDTVTVKNLSASPNPIDYHSHGHSGGKDGSVSANASQNFTAVGTHYILSQGRSTVTITGGQYGS